MLKFWLSIEPLSHTVSEKFPENLEGGHMPPPYPYEGLNGSQIGINDPKAASMTLRTIELYYRLSEWYQ